MQKKNILFTGGGGAGNEAIWSLLNSKYDLYFADAEISNIDDIIPRDKAIRIPLASDDGFVRTLQKKCVDYQIDFLVPSVDEELFKLSSSKHLFSCEVFLPDENFIELMLNKYSCMKALEENQLLSPKTFYVKDSLLLNFPFIVKPKSGRGSRGVILIDSEKELSAYKVLYKTQDEDLIVQQYISGQEYTVLVSVNSSGELNCIVPIKVHQKKGVTISAEIDINEQIIEYVKKFHEKFPVKSIYNIQCMLTDDGSVIPFEVNPRISTTFCMSLAVGFDPFEMFYDKGRVLFQLNKHVRE